MLMLAVILCTTIFTGTILQQSVAQTTTTVGGGNNATPAGNTTTAAAGNATANRTAIASPNIGLNQTEQQAFPFAGGEQFIMTASDTRFPGSQFNIIVNNTGALRNLISSIVQQPLTGISGQSLILPPPPGLRTFANDPSLQGYVDQIINDILRTRATASPIGPPQGAPGRLNPVGSLCYDISWFHVCIERVS